MFAKEITNQEVRSDRYELFTTTTVKDVNGKDVTIPQSIGTYTIAELENQKLSYTNEIAKIDEKIAAIELL